MQPSVYVRLLAGSERQLFIVAIMDRQGARLHYKTFEKLEQVRRSLEGTLPRPEIDRVLREAVQAEPV